MSIKEEILEIISLGPTPAADIMALPYSRNTLQIYLKAMVEAGEIHRYGKGKQTTYTLDKVDTIIKPFPKKKEVPLVLPDLPPIMINWMGYTDKVPDPDAGEYVHGGQW